MNNDKTAIISKIRDAARDMAGEGNGTGATLENACKVFLKGYPEQYIKIIEDLERLPNSERARNYLAQLKSASSEGLENVESQKPESEPESISVNKETPTPVAEPNDAPEEEQASVATEETTVDEVVTEESSELEYHDLANLFPMMSDEDSERLKEDIEANGQREPIWLYQGEIIDGRNRYEACRELGKKPETKTWEGSKDSLLEFVISLNIHRRHLNSSQRAVIAQSLLPVLKEKAKERQGARTDMLEKIPECEMGNARAQAAKLIGGTNEKYVSYAERIKDESPKAFEAIKAGKKTISEVIRELNKKATQSDSGATAPKQKEETTVSVDMVELSIDAFKMLLELIPPNCSEGLKAIMKKGGPGTAKTIIEERVKAMEQKEDNAEEQRKEAA